MKQLLAFKADGETKDRKPYREWEILADDEDMGAREGDRLFFVPGEDSPFLICRGTDDRSRVVSTPSPEAIKPYLPAGAPEWDPGREPPLHPIFDGTWIPTGERVEGFVVSPTSSVSFAPGAVPMVGKVVVRTEEGFFRVRERGRLTILGGPESSLAEEAASVAGRDSEA